MNIELKPLTPKQKAEELVSEYVLLLQETDSCLGVHCESAISCQHSWYSCEGWLRYAKKSAIIAVDELIRCLPTFDNKNFFNEGASEYWEEVKKEIDLL